MYIEENKAKVLLGGYTNANVPSVRRISTYLSETKARRPEERFAVIRLPIEQNNASAKIAAYGELYLDCGALKFIKIDAGGTKTSIVNKRTELNEAVDSLVAVCRRAFGQGWDVKILGDLDCLLGKTKFGWSVENLQLLKFVRGTKW